MEAGAATAATAVIHESGESSQVNTERIERVTVLEKELAVAMKDRWPLHRYFWRYPSND